jgi:hypothetical protein
MSIPRLKTGGTNAFLDKLITNVRANEVEQLNRGDVLIDDALNATPEYRPGPLSNFDVDNLTELQLSELNQYPEETYEDAKNAYLQKIDDERLQEERDKLYEEIDRAFEKEDTDFFQDEIATTSKAAADEALRQTVLVDNELQKSVKTMFPGIPGMDFKMLNLFGYNFTAGIDDTGAFITAPASFRFPTSKNLTLDDSPKATAVGEIGTLLTSNPIITALRPLGDKAFQAYNEYMDENKTKNLTEIESLNNFEKLLGLLQDNSISKGFVDAAKENRAIGETYKLQNKSIANDGFGVLKDPKYWADLVFSGAGSLIPYLLGGSAVAKAGTRIGLSTTTNTLSTAALMNNMETAQIATDVASKVFTQTLDKHTDGAFTAGQNNYVNQEMQKQMAFLKEQGKDVSEQGLIKFELELKDQYLKQFVEANPEETKKAHQAAVKGFSQAAAVNSLNFVTNLTGANLLVGGIKRELLKKPLKQLAGAGFGEAAREAIEEGGGNYIAEKSGIARGMNAKYGSSELLDDLISLEAFEQALAGATLGFMSGNAIVSSNYSNIKDSYQKQQAVLEKYNSIADKNIVDQDLLLITASTLSRNEKVKELLQQHTIAKTTGDAIAQTAIEDIIIAEQTTDAVSNGTLPSLLAMYNKIATNNSNSTQTKTKALEIINDINATTKLVEDNINLKNVGEVVHKEVLLRSNDKQKFKVTNDLNATYSKLIDHAATFKVPKKKDETEDTSIVVNTNDITINPYEAKTPEHKVYKDFLKSEETAKLFPEYYLTSLYLDSLDKSSTQTREQLGILKSKKHQKKLEAKEQLALRLKSTKKSILDDTIKKASKNDNALFEKLKDRLTPKTREEYNKEIDDVTNAFSKKNLIPTEELEALKNIFKLSNDLSPTQAADIDKLATDALVEEATKAKAKELKEEQEKQLAEKEKADKAKAVVETDESAKKVELTTEEVNKQQEARDKQELVSAYELLKDPVLKAKHDLAVENTKIALEQLAEQQRQLENEIQIYELQIDKALTEQSKNVLSKVVEDTKLQLEEVKLEIIKFDAQLIRLQDMLIPFVPNNVEQQDAEFDSTLGVVITTEIPKKANTTSNLTEAQINESNRQRALLGLDPITTNNSASTVDNPVVTTTFEQTSTIRTKRVPLLGNFLVSQKTNSAKQIKEAFEAFIYAIDDPNVSAFNRVLSYEIDKAMIDVFGLARQENSGKYPGIQAVMSFLNNGFIQDKNTLNDPTNAVAYLSDELVLALQIRVKLDAYTYTYLVDDGYFKLGNLEYDSAGNVIFEDGRKMTITEFNNYKQLVINEKREIITKILTGQEPKSQIVKQDYGSLARTDEVFTNIDQMVDFNNTVNKFFIIKENNEVDGGGVTDLTDVKSNNLSAGTLAIGTTAPTGNIILEGLKANNLTEQESKLLLEAAKIIIDNPGQAGIPTDIEVDGVVLSSGIAPLVIFDLVSNLITINKTTKDKTNRLENQEFKIALAEVEKALEESEEKALNYFKAKFRKSSKEGINKSIKETIDAFNKLSGVSRIENPYTKEANILGINITDEFSYNQFVASGHSTNANKLARTNSGIVTKLIQEEPKADNSIEETPATVTLPTTSVGQSQQEIEAKKADIERRRQEDFNNPNESYRVIVGDEAFNDILETGVVRTNAESKAKKEGGIDLTNRPTAYPSFSKGKASMDYAAENPNNYIIVTEDSSIQPSKVGRHGKGTTMFPTDKNGNHLKELSGEKVKVYKHIGNGEYILVYANGKEINAKYDTEYIEAVKKGEMTKEQAMQALEEVGRKDSSAYAELAALEQPAIDPTKQFLDEYNGNPDNTAFSTISSATELVRDETLTKQTEWLQENLPQFPASEYNYLLPLVNDKIALGYFFTGLEGVVGEDSNFGIRYSSFQPKNDRERGIIYHEAFHAVVRALISEKEYNDLLKIDTEENLAEAFRLYIRFGEPYNSKKVMNLFDRIVQYILNLLDLGNDAKINKLFSDIATGKYKYAPVRTDRINAFGRTYSTTNASITSLVAKEFAKSVVMMALDNTNLEIVEKITNKHINDAIYLAIVQHKQNPGTEAAETFNKFLANYNILARAEKEAVAKLEDDKPIPDNILVVEANKYLQNIIKEAAKDASDNYIAEVDLDNNEALNNEESSSDISAHTVDSNLVNYNLKSPKFVKVLLASIPKLDTDGNYTYNKYTGLRQPVNYGSLYTSLLEYLQGSFNDIIVSDTTVVTNKNLAKYKVIDGLRELSVFKPELKQLVNYLTKIKENPNDTPQDIIIKKANLERRQGLFYAAMALNKESYLSVTYRPEVDENGDETGRYTLTTWESGKTGPSSELVQKWQGKADWENKILNIDEFNNVSFNKENVSAIGAATFATDKELGAIKLKVADKTRGEIPQNKLNEYYNEAAAKILEYFDKQLGVKMGKNALDLFVYTKGKKSKFNNISIDGDNKNYSIQAINELIGIYAHTSKIFRGSNKHSFVYKNIQPDGKNPTLKDVRREFKRSFEDLAKYQYLFEDHLGAATIKGADNKPVFLFDFQSHLLNMVNFMQSNTPESNAYMQKLHSRVEHGNSQYSEKLQSGDINVVRLLQKVDKRDPEDRGVTGTTISLKDDLVMNINLTLNGLLNPEHFKSYVRLLSFADKGTSDIFYSMDSDMVQLPISVFDIDGNISKINETTVSIFYDYLLSELERVTYTGDILTKNTKKNKLNIYNFPSFSPTAKNIRNNNVARFIKTIVDKKEPNQNLREIMDSFIDENGNKIQYYIQEELIKVANKEIAKYKKNLILLDDINAGIVEKFTDIHGRNNALNALIATAALNSSIAFIETTKLFVGSKASFKDTKDFNKRTPLIITKGNQYAPEDVNDLKFNLAVIKTKFKTSTIYSKELVESFRPLLEKKYSEFIKEKKLKKTIADFKDRIDTELDNLYTAYNQRPNKEGEQVNQLDTTDAQGYITLDRWYKIVKGLHKSNRKVDALYQKLKDGKATYDDFYDAQMFLQPIKGVISELHMSSSNFTTPIYIKYSQFILTPQLVATSKGLTDLYNKMIAEGTDEVVFDTASKGDFLEI